MYVFLFHSRYIRSVSIPRILSSKQATKMEANTTTKFPCLFDSDPSGTCITKQPSLTELHSISPALKFSLLLRNNNKKDGFLQTFAISFVARSRTRVTKDTGNFQERTEVPGLWQLIITPDCVAEAISVSATEFWHNVGRFLDFIIKTKWQIWFLMAKP